MNKKLSTIIAIVSGLLFLSPAYAAVDIQTIAGMPKDATAAEFIVYFFNLAVAIGGFIAVIVIISAGIDYITAKGEPAKIESAKGKIKNTLLGVVILLGSYMILNIINPSLSTIKINELSKEQQQNQTPETTKPEGIYLYAAQGDPLLIKDTMPSLITDKFNGQLQYVKFINQEAYRYAAILFTDGDLRGNCSYIFNNIDDLGVANGKENNPPIGKNAVNSIQVFKAKAGSPTVTIYNTVDCKKRSDAYGTVDEKTSICKLNIKDGFNNIQDDCPGFVGPALSIAAGPDVGVLLKAMPKDQLGKCQFFTAGNSSCINTIKDSYVYNPNPNSLVMPVSYVLFPLYTGP